MSRQGNRWSIVVIFFFFMLLHQSDRLLIGPLTTPIMETFHIDEAQMGAVFTGAVLVGGILYPIWGYLYDRFARARLLALASFIWGSTTWLSAIAPTYGTFLATRATTGIDDSSYPGLYSLISDYFGPGLRGRIYGLLQLTQPLGYLVGMLLAMSLRDVLGWRGVFYLTGTLGIILSVVILLGVKEAPRGRAEPEMADLVDVGIYRFDAKVALNLIRKPSMILLFIQGFFGVFPWQVITYWFFRYLETERKYPSDVVLVTMMVAVLVLASGYFVGGSLGDFMFRRTRRGRILVATTGVILGMIFLVLTLSTPAQQYSQFMLFLVLTALFMPFAAPNVISTIYDITPPEVRSTALSISSFIEQGGSATAPLLAGLIAVGSSLGNAILIICTAGWAVCATVFLAVGYMLPRDIEALRELMRRRADAERARSEVTA
jgi:MFS family permease